MASLKNSPGEYCLEQKEFVDQKKYLLYKYSQIPLQSKLPGLGINAGNMRGGYFNNILSNNASNIESNFNLGKIYFFKGIFTDDRSPYEYFSLPPHFSS